MVDRARQIHLLNANREGPYNVPCNFMTNQPLKKICHDVHLVSLFSLYVVIQNDMVDVILTASNSVLGMEKYRSCVPLIHCTLDLYLQKDLSMATNPSS